MTQTRRSRQITDWHRATYSNYVRIYVQDKENKENQLDALWQDMKAGFTYQRVLDTGKQQQEEWLSAATAKKVETQQKRKEAMKLPATQER